MYGFWVVRDPPLCFSTIGPTVRPSGTAHFGACSAFRAAGNDVCCCLIRELLALRWRALTPRPLSANQSGGQTVRRPISLLVCLAIVTTVSVQAANASSIVSTSNVKVISLGINEKGQALVSYTQGGATHQTLAYGAENALVPAQGAKQVDFTYDYSGGYTLFKDDLEKAVAQLRADQISFKQAQAAAAKLGTKYTPDVLKYSAAIKTDNAAIQALHVQAAGFSKSFACKAYTGEKLAFEVAACTAPDGSYWALQQWQRQLPDYGVTPSATQSSDELHLSHWTGALPILAVQTDWSYHK